MKQTKISVGIACLIMSSSFAALAGGPAPVVNTSNPWTIYMNVNGDLSSRTGKFNETRGTAVKNDAWTLGGGVNIGIAGKLTNQVNAFAQLSIDQFAESSLTNLTAANGDGYRFAAETNTLKDNTTRLDKAYVNWNSADGIIMVQAGEMSILDMSTFTLSNLNAWSPNTMGFDINSVTDLFGPSRSNLLTNGSVFGTTTFNERGIGFGSQAFSHLYATFMYSVLPDSATTATKEKGFFGKRSASDLQAQLAWKTNNWVVALNYLGNRALQGDAPAGVADRDQGFNVQGACRLGKLVFTANYDHLTTKNVTPNVKTTGYGAGASYNLDLFGFNHTFQFNWFRDDNGKTSGGVAQNKANSFQINDIVPLFSKHFNMIPFYVTTDKTNTSTNKNTQFGILFQGLWSVNV